MSKKRKIFHQSLSFYICFENFKYNIVAQMYCIKINKYNLILTLKSLLQIQKS